MDALLIVDFHTDFAPGGALAVPRGDKIGPVLEPLVDRFDVVIATRDWHPPDHSLFGDEWPVHCVQGTHGAELHAALDRAKVDHVVDKGQDTRGDGYSAFEGTGLDALLRPHGVQTVFVAGLATDYCVKNTVVDALRLGFHVTVITDAIRGVDVHPGGSARAIEVMKGSGAAMARSSDV